MATQKYDRVLVFGVFDHLHPGHFAFLEEAKSLGEKLFVVVARDTTVESLKGRRPEWPEAERLKNVGLLPYVRRVHLGDLELGTYDVVQAVRPDVICLGYDQDGLRADLERAMGEGRIPQIPLQIMSAYEPDKFRSSLFRKPAG